MVRPENKLSYVLKLQKMRQEQYQPVTHFSASVRAAARRCQFRVMCRCLNQVSYEDDMALYQLLSGLSDMEVQTDLLARTDPTLSEAERYSVDKEMAKRSQEAMHQEEVGRIKSTYKRQKAATGASKSKTGLCTHCGKEVLGSRQGRKGQSGIAPCAAAEAIQAPSASPGSTSPVPARLFELSTKFVTEPERAFLYVVQCLQSNCLPTTVTVNSYSLPHSRAHSSLATTRTATCTAMADTGGDSHLLRSQRPGRLRSRQD